MSWWWMTMARIPAPAPSIVLILPGCQGPSNAATMDGFGRGFFRSTTR